jgi:hypothetical protein
MLPDLRIVIAAVVSTFVLTVGVGFFASSRLIHDQMMARIDRAQDDTPINRIALNWPEPTKAEPSLNLDFAVSAKVAKNPVRDVTPTISATPQTDSSPTVQPAASGAPEPADEKPAETAKEMADGGSQESVSADSMPPRDAVTEAKDEAAPAPDISAPDPVTPAAEAVSPTPDKADDAPAAVALAPAATDSETAEAAASVPPSPDSPAVQTDTAENAPEGAAPQAETQIVVPLNETALEDSTGSISTPAPQALNVPLPAARPQLALQHEPSRPLISEPARAYVKRRTRRSVSRASAPKPQPQPAQIPAFQPFDFFGLFRNAATAQRLPLQIATPTTPVN